MQPVTPLWITLPVVATTLSIPVVAWLAFQRVARRSARELIAPTFVAVAVWLVLAFTLSARGFFAGSGNSSVPPLAWALLPLAAGYLGYLTHKFGARGGRSDSAPPDNRPAVLSRAWRRVSRGMDARGSARRVRAAGRHWRCRHRLDRAIRGGAPQGRGSACARSRDPVERARNRGPRCCGHHGSADDARTAASAGARSSKCRDHHVAARPRSDHRRAVLHSPSPHRPAPTGWSRAAGRTRRSTGGLSGAGGECTSCRC